jgi:dienelactone hydrolase
LGLNRTLSLLIVAMLAACASPAQRSDREAQAAGLSRTIVQGTSFRHLIYARAAAGKTSRLTVFIEGDGIPWLGGRIPASDPTTHNPLALRLLIESHDAAIYVTRPCYNQIVDRACDAQQWTFARYSDEAVASMTKAIDDYARAARVTELRIVGYSGGGVLAVLVAERLTYVSSVVTLAANLDVGAWTAHHGYLPLSQSLDPARSARTHGWKEIHLQGGRDTAVPSATTRAYFERYPAAKTLSFAEYDHVCCWLRDWSAIEQRIANELR